MNENEVKELLNRYRSGAASEDDKALLESWYLNFQESEGKTLSMNERLEDVDSAWQYLNSKHTSTVKVRIWPRILAAASVLIFLSASIIYLVNRNSASGLDVVHLANSKFDIAPVNHHATLTYLSGKTVTLSNSKSGVVINGTKLTYDDGTKIDASAKNVPVKAEQLSLQTTKGGTYQLLLPDGTKVWLNAASLITFPSSFAGLSERRVELTGEAYFEVAKNKSVPFKVFSAGQVVQVLGTHFDINTYQNERTQKTTLLEGSVLINQTLLKPGEQARLDGGKVTVVPANIDETIGWKNNYIVFEDEKIESIMRKIARWYDVEIVYEGEKPRDDFGGRVSRSAYVSQVLKKLEFTNKVHFRIEGRRITVSK